MVIAVLASDSNHEYYLQKMTTGSELIEHHRESSGDFREHIVCK
jgi:hypothetical protein